MLEAVPEAVPEAVAVREVEEEAEAAPRCLGVGNRSRLPIAAGVFESAHTYM